MGSVFGAPAREEAKLTTQTYTTPVLTPLAPSPAPIPVASPPANTSGVVEKCPV